MFRFDTIGQAALLGACVLIAGCLDDFRYDNPAPPQIAPIVAENAKPGDDGWLLTKTKINDPSRSLPVEGYCSHQSIRVGETLKIFVSTDPVSKFNLDIYRLGYYDGQGARKMKSFADIEGQTQATPEPGPRNVRECHWEPSVEFAIPDDWLSGVYLGKLTAVPSDFQSYVIFVVRDDREADFIFQVSDLTWHAYNRWPGWASLYDFGDDHWYGGPSNNVSFDRPYARYINMTAVTWDNARPYTGAGSFLFCEFPLAYWMEKEGYDVTYISQVDTHEDAEGLLRARGFISIGHDEYWSRQAFANVTAARDAGVSLAFLSANTSVVSVEFDPSSDGRANRQFRRSTTYDDEQDLTGAAAYGRGFGDWVCTAPDHWIYEGTGMQEGDVIEELIGWEYQGEPLKNDPSLEIVARGQLTDIEENEPGEFVATVYEGPKGNIVFNAATIWWAMPLASPPGFRHPHRVKADWTRDDPRVQQMTKNVFARMLADPRPESSP
ncbi:MAG: hypothetical protein DWQ31_15715 [Planctomycetota bacterium]|nr:MAG: hypothetical protein DWQ31_15715 [Planctomycetota bacterium]REJ97388.1 MAG: hypothetical protein DWQ35_02190 [Planctomycetota bacterium]REK27701.1 MAG: hypothetical protein DWQ42_06980 [Planctomycetota bacterium]REK38457.1 MAG: hypothetical protein DWQ46_20205 [Planctomycetota bacterium]